MSGCAICVYDLYLEDLENFHSSVSAARSAVLDQLREGARLDEGDWPPELLGPWEDAEKELKGVKDGASGEEREQAAREQAERELKRARDALDPSMRCVSTSPVVPGALIDRRSVYLAQRLPRDGGPHEGQAAREDRTVVACAWVEFALERPAVKPLRRYLSCTVWSSAGSSAVAQRYNTPPDTSRRRTRSCGRRSQRADGGTRNAHRRGFKRAGHRAK